MFARWHEPNTFGFFHETEMARKLKTYVTASGFFDLAVAAPSMKAALEIWGARSNLFNTGLAKETEEPDIIKATMANPGTVLRRPVGASGVFKLDAEAPKLSALGKAGKQKPLPLQKKVKSAPAKKAVPPAADHKAAQLYDLAQKRREREEQRAEEAQRRDRDRRDKAVEKAQADLDAAREKYQARLADIEAEREVLDRKTRTEKHRWEQEKEKLEATIKRARS